MERPSSFWFYKRVKISSPKDTIFFDFATGLGFLMRSFIIMQPDHKVVAGPLTLGFPGVGIELENGSGEVRWQKDAIPAALYSSPRKDAIITKTETAPVDATGYGVSMSATIHKPRQNLVNLYYEPGETIIIRISGQEFITPPGIWGPDFVDILVLGYYIP